MLIYAVATNVFSVLWGFFVGWGIYDSEVAMRAVHMLPEVIALAVLEVLAARLLAEKGAVRYPGTVFAMVAAAFHFLRYRRVLTAPFEYQAAAFVEAVILFAIGVTAYRLASRTTHAETN